MCIYSIYMHNKLLLQEQKTKNYHKIDQKVGMKKNFRDKRNRIFHYEVINRPVACKRKNFNDCVNYG